MPIEIHRKNLDQNYENKGENAEKNIEKNEEKKNEILIWKKLFIKKGINYQVEVDRDRDGDQNIYLNALNCFPSFIPQNFLFLFSSFLSEN